VEKMDGEELDGEELDERSWMVRQGG